MSKCDKLRTDTEKTKLPGRDFIAPDGGWGWMIVLAAGTSNLCILPVLQQFGFLFRDRFEQIGLTNSEITSIINIHVALTSCIGLANGPMFKRFSYRAVSLCGASLIVVALLLTSIANSFITYLLSFSVLYGTGIGVCMSANALALNTYFCKRRRYATALSWTVTALGPIVMPYLVTTVLLVYGLQDTMLLSAGLALHAVVCALLLQPAQRYSKHKEEDTELLSNKDQQMNGRKENEYSYYNTPTVSRRSRSIFSSQYLYNDDASYDIIDTATPMLSRANDGWYSSEKRSLASSKLSLASSRKFHMSDMEFKKSSQNISKKPSFASLADSKSRKTSTTNLTEMRSRKSSIGLASEQKFKRQKSQTGTATRIEEGIIHDTNHTNNNIRSNLSEIKSRKDSLTIPEQKLKRQKSHSSTSGTIDEDAVDLQTNNDVKNNLPEIRSRKSSITLQDHKQKRQKHHSVTIKIDESEIEDCPSNKAPQDIRDYEKHRLLENKSANEYYDKRYINDNNSIKSPKHPEYKEIFNIETDILKEASKKLEEYATKCDSNKNELQNHNNNQQIIDVDEDNQEEQLTFWQKIVIFFDLYLLKDFTYVNLMLGITLANFAELNFSILTPFVLGDFGLDQTQIATAMSLLGGMDILVRFFIPFVAEWSGWENKTFFLIGVMGMAMGRIVLVHFRSYAVILCATAWIGLNKGLRTVFMALVLPSYVPLQRLPAATGLQLLCAGLLYPTAGPLVGWIRDTTNYSVTLHCLNVMTYVTAISWIFETIYRSRNKSRSEFG